MLAFTSGAWGFWFSRWFDFRNHLVSKRLPFGGVDVRPIHRSEVLAAAVSVEDSRPTFGCAIEFTGWGSAAYPLR